MQLTSELVDTDPAGAKALLDELGRDVQQALDEAGRLAERIYPPLLDAGGLAVALRSAAVSAGIPASVEVAADLSYPPEVARTVYLCWLDALEHADAQARATITVRKEKGALAFEFVEDPGRSAPVGLQRLRDRVEALGGQLTIRPEPGGGSHVSGSLPLSR